jgi:hypothetical protein
VNIMLGISCQPSSAGEHDAAHEPADDFPHDWITSSMNACLDRRTPYRPCTLE